MLPEHVLNTPAVSITLSPVGVTSSAISLSIGPMPFLIALVSASVLLAMCSCSDGGELAGYAMTETMIVSQSIVDRPRRKVASNGVAFLLGFGRCRTVS